MWDARYNRPDFLFGTEPNDFLRDVYAHIPSGKVLCIGEGQGRNAVYLAQQGFTVTAMDGSAVGLEKARALAKERAVTMHFDHADLQDYVIEPNTWAAVVSIFVHLPVALRRDVHRRIIAGLQPGGLFIHESYQPIQITYGTGGPRDPQLLASLETLQHELEGLELKIAREIERDISEGPGHQGRSAVVQILGRKPA